MPVRLVAADAGLNVRRSGCVVGVVVRECDTPLALSLGSALTHTDSAVPILVIDPGACVGGAAELDRVLGFASFEREVLLLETGGDRHSAIDAFAAMAAPADVALLDAACEVGAGWLDGLRAAALDGSAVATASALVLAAGQLSIGPHAIELDVDPDRASFERISAEVARASGHIRPRFAPVAADCMYIKRGALELAGASGRFRPFADRCLELGLAHVAADDVVVRRQGTRPRTAGHATAGSPEARCLNAARRAIVGLSLVVDARALGGPMDGTRVHLLELIGALARTGQVQLQVVVGPQVDPDARRILSGCEGVELIVLEPGTRPPRGDVVHRPYQVWSPPDVALLRALGERVVVTQQDLIGYRNRAYFGSERDWEHFRLLTRRALALADRVVFLSDHAKADGLRDDLLEPQRASVVRLGTDHRLVAPAERAARPASAGALPDGAATIVCIGTDLHHKNRVFTLEVVQQLRRRHGWDGWLVFAGPHIEHGSSASEEDEFLSGDAGLAGRTLDLGTITEAEKRWLLERASIVFYPTTCEGFGLVPFEAAAHGAPCMWAPGGALSELLPDEQARIVPWSPAGTAEQVRVLESRSAERERNVATILAAAAELRWEQTAVGLLEVYGRACDDPPPSAATLYAMEPESALSADALSLLGPDGALPSELEAPLLALARRPRLSAPLFGALKAAYGVSTRARAGLRRAGGAP